MKGLHDLAFKDSLIDFVRVKCSFKLIEVTGVRWPACRTGHIVLQVSS